MAQTRVKLSLPYILAKTWLLWQEEGDAMLDVRGRCCELHCPNHRISPIYTRTFSIGHFICILLLWRYMVIDQDVQKKTKKQHLCTNIKQSPLFITRMAV